MVSFGICEILLSRWWIQMRVEVCRCSDSDNGLRVATISVMTALAGPRNLCHRLLGSNKTWATSNKQSSLESSITHSFYWKNCYTLCSVFFLQCAPTWLLVTQLLCSFTSQNGSKMYQILKVTYHFHNQTELLCLLSGPLPEISWKFFCCFELLVRMIFCWNILFLLVDAS